MSTLLTTAQAAAILAISPKTLLNWRYERQGPPYIRVGSAIRYREADLLAWVDAQAVAVGAGV